MPADARDERGFRQRLTRRSQAAINDVADALIDNPLFGQAVDSASGARDRALAARKTAMGALDVSSAADVERLERRLRSLGDRLEEVEDAVDRLTAELAALREHQTEPQRKP